MRRTKIESGVLAILATGQDDGTCHKRIAEFLEGAGLSVIRGQLHVEDGACTATYAGEGGQMYDLIEVRFVPPTMGIKQLAEELVHRLAGSTGETDDDLVNLLSSHVENAGFILVEEVTVVSCDQCIAKIVGANGEIVTVDAKWGTVHPRRSSRGEYQHGAVAM